MSVACTRMHVCGTCSACVCSGVASPTGTRCVCGKIPILREAALTAEPPSLLGRLEEISGSPCQRGALCHLSLRPTNPRAFPTFSCLRDVLPRGGPASPCEREVGKRWLVRSCLLICLSLLGVPSLGDCARVPHAVLSRPCLLLLRTCAPLRTGVGSRAPLSRGCLRSPTWLDCASKV